ncbi:MAG: ABC transporter permease [Nitrospirota bacterium]|nr:ABC transporter permease [Nitrospirota bacterium]
MARYILIRFLWMIPTFLGITLISFLIIHMAPGDPAELMAGGGLGAGSGVGLSTENRAAVDQAVVQWREQFGLDRPLHEQYFVWLGHLFTLEFGESFKDHQPVWNKMAERLPITILLNVLSILLIYLVAIPLGIYSATHPYTAMDRLTTVGAFILFSLPTFWVAILAIVFLGGGDFLAVFPPGGLHATAYSESWPWLRRAADLGLHLFLPVLIMSYGGFAELSRFMRGSLLEVLTQNYILTARAKGLTERVVIYKHALRNSLVPMVTILAGILPALIGGSVIIETIFSIPGIGQLGFQAVLARDYPVIMAVFTMGAFVTLVSILLSDFLLTLVDPRISFGRRSAS